MTVPKLPVYLDFNATTPLDDGVREAMLPWMEVVSNANSAHHYGRAARNAVELAREQVAALIGASPAEIIFTSGATSAIHLALECALAAASVQKSVCMRSAVEHSAVLNAFAARKHSFTELVTPVLPSGLLDVASAKAAWAERVLLAAIQLANSETGVVQTLPEIAKTAKKRGTLLLCDATQAAGKMPINVTELGVDLLALSAHKMYGPQGAGALFISAASGLPVVRQMKVAETALGTLNVAAIAGFGAAAVLATSRQQSDSAAQLKLRERLEAGLLSVEGASLNGHPHQRLPNTTNICFEGVNATMLLEALQKELAASTGSACSVARKQASHVLKAMQCSPAHIQSSLRLSLGRSSIETDIDYIVHRLGTTVSLLRQAPIS